MVIFDDIHEKRYKRFNGRNPTIPYQLIMENSLDEILTSQDGRIRIVEFFVPNAGLMSQEDVRLLIESDIDNWTVPLP